eukprot:scaffold24757_cov50-Phaeocystis_antarctica.AAC.1
MSGGWLCLLSDGRRAAPFTVSSRRSTCHRECKHVSSGCSACGTWGEVAASRAVTGLGVAACGTKACSRCGACGCANSMAAC